MSSSPREVRVLLFGTHPRQFNGYSKVIYELCKRTYAKSAAAPDAPIRIRLGVFGFQNYPVNTAQHRPDLPFDVYVFDAFANEQPQGAGFGLDLVGRAVEEFKPDVCIVYNDMLIVTNVLAKLHELPQRAAFKVLVYLDQVYLHQKKQYIAAVNERADGAILFTEYWRKNIVDQGLAIPTYVMEHGFDAKTYYPIPREVARAYLGLRPDDFLILNLNRNQPRKRWDTCLKAFADLVSRMPDAKIKLIVGTQLQGSWDLLEIYERELRKRGISMQDGMKHLVLIDNPQKLSDFDVNVLYNVADIGINTCDGEGFGLCNFEQAAIGVPQVVPRLGGFIDYLDDDCAMMVDPTIAYYVDHSRDHVCGEALMCTYQDFVLAIESYYEDRAGLRKHGERCRERIPKKYDWDVIADKFIGIVGDVTKPPPPPAADALETTPVIEVRDQEGQPPPDEEVPASPAAPSTSSLADVFSNAAAASKRDPKKKKGGSKKRAQLEAELVAMRATIDRLVAAAEKKN